LFLFAAIYLISSSLFNICLCVLSFSFIFYCIFSVFCQHMRLLTFSVTNVFVKWLVGGLNITFPWLVSSFLFFRVEARKIGGFLPGVCSLW
jgi:hypothetical protein